MFIGLTSGKTRALVRRAALDLTRSRHCIALYLLLALPSLFALCVVVGPFQALDESAHFYRAVQLAEGRILAVRSPDAAAAGDLLDTSLYKLGGYFADASYQNWQGLFAPGPADLRAAWATGLTGERQFTRFSNTAIYFPIAHMVPAAAIAVARALDAPPLAWLYAGRAINVALALVIICVAIAWFDEGRAFIFVLALLPRTLFGIASLSPDALLVPLAMLFAALVATLARRGTLTAGQYFLLLVAALFIGVSKLAYLPLVFIAPAVAFLAARRMTPAVWLTLAGAVAVTAVWAGWMLVIKPNVFPIRHNVHIDIWGQLHLLLAHPLFGLTVLKNSFAVTGLGYLNTLVGGDLGSHAARFPVALSLVSYALLAWSAVAAAAPLRTRWPELAVSGVVVAGVGAAIFLLLYMQYTELGHFMVDGVQGRYFTPLLPVVVAFLPKLAPAVVRARLLTATAVLWLAATSIITVDLMHARYSGPGVPGAQRFSAFVHTDVE